MTERKGVTVQMAKIEMRRRLTLIGAMLLHKDEVDGMICGTWGTTADPPALHRPGDRQARRASHTYACMNGLMLPGRQVFLVDTHVNYDPTAEQLAEITVHGGRGDDALRPQAEGGAAVAFQLRQQQPAQRREDAPDAGPAARAGALAGSGRRNARRRGARRRAARNLLMPHSTLAGDANLLVLPNIDAANISYNLLKTAAGGNIAIGPVLLGAAKPVHILTASATVRRIVNMTALTVADANADTIRLS